MLKPQDIIVTTRLLLARKRAESCGYVQLSQWTGLSVSETHASVKRATLAGLVQPDMAGNSGDFGWAASPSAATEFIDHALKYVFPLDVGAIQRGIPTGTAVPGVNLGPASLVEAENWVWPSAEGSMRGVAIKPLYKSTPKVAIADSDFHQCLACLDLVRSKSHRCRRLGMDWLQNHLLRRL
jgi:hypothetical protein